MRDISNVIKECTYDIISVITIWSLLNHPYLHMTYPTYNKNIIIFNDIHPVSRTLVGLGVSFYVLSKYY
jgi:hypothetical protein